MNEFSEQGEAVFMPRAGTNSSRVAGVQFRLMLIVCEYWPRSQTSQAWSSGVVQFKLDKVWPSPVESGSMSTFKWDPALQHRTRECGDSDAANNPFDFCQSALHNICLNAVAPLNTVNEHVGN